MRFRILLVAMFVGCLCGCIYLNPPDEWYFRRHYVVQAHEVDRLDGPYEVLEVPSSKVVVAEKDGKKITIVMRGCATTGVEESDKWARRMLGTMWPSEIYLRADCSVVESTNVIRGVIYEPGNQFYTGTDEKGKMHYRNADYLVPQVLLLCLGDCLLDHSDTNYPLYKVFLGAEASAKWHRKGYWKTHREPPGR